MTNEEEKKQFDLVKVENGVAVVSKAVDNLLLDLESKQNMVAKLEETIRGALLTQMIQHNVVSTKTELYTISQVVPADKEIFDVDKFLVTDTEDIVKAFASVNARQTFDEERFKLEHPDLYDKYQKVDYTTQVDTAKLRSVFPEKYDAYTTIEKSKKAITLRIAKNKNKK